MYKFLLVIVTVMFFIGCGGDSSNNNEQIPQGTVSISKKVQQTTPKGAHVFSENGVSDAQLATADKGLDTTFNNAKISGYNSPREMSHTFYSIYVPKYACVPSPETHTPSFKVRGDNYDGSVYDQYNTKGELPPDQQNDFAKYVPDGIGVVYAAEMVLNPGYAPSNQAEYLVCLDDAVWENGVSYGAEHAIIANLDPAYNDVTATHSVYSHPLLPKKGAARTAKKNNIPKGEYIIRAVK